jgi:Flp pilus assembly protein TadG
LLEFALILPIFALIIFGIVDFGRIIIYYSAMSNAARESARLGSIHISDSNREAQVCQEAIYWSISGDISCDDVISIWNYNNGTITVSINYTFEPVTPLFQSMNLQSRSIMQLEYVPNNNP